ncbi:uncharacterized protein LOC143371795 isoform X2 [Andrena cerasifolii]|uniref:uncharacterized protein LOC143371795 isoform X2 n=1 Tax=Andrena cerasifolii TaxID=2819439 RepID=UPI004038184D
MCASGTEPCCHRFHVQAFKSFWHRKLFAVLASLAFVAIFALIAWRSVFAPVRFPEGRSRDRYMDTVVESVYRDGVRWYNGKVLSASSPQWNRYMDELRRDWIIWNHNPNQPYNLEYPDQEDTSMGQASAIREALKDKENGFFVECGAYDGETRSNTLVLERFRGWKGLLVEADPLNFSKMLQKNRRAYMTPTCLGIVPYPTVSNFLMARNVGRLHEPNDTDTHLPNSPDVAHSGTHVSVQCIPFIHLMNALNVTTVDYFSLDIEGNELKVLKTIPFDEINIVTLSVEFSHAENGRKDLIDFMELKGYYIYSFVVRSDKLAHDIIFVKQDNHVAGATE